MRPAAELAESDWRGRCFLLILADVVEEDPANFGPELNAVLARTGGQAVYDLLIERMPELPPDVLIERLSLMTMIILRAVADRARIQARPTRGPGVEGSADHGPAAAGPSCPYEAFVANLVAMVAAAVAAPDRVGPPAPATASRTRRGPLT